MIGAVKLACFETGRARDEQLARQRSLCYLLPIKRARTCKAHCNGLPLSSLVVCFAPLRAPSRSLFFVVSLACSRCAGGRCHFTSVFNPSPLRVIQRHPPSEEGTRSS